MRAEKALVVAGREYMVRIRTKGFWFGTIALPVLMLGAILLPAVFMATTKISHRTVVVDETGKVGGVLVDRLTGGSRLEAKSGNLQGPAARFEAVLEKPLSDPDAQGKRLNERLREGEIDSWIRIRSGVLDGERPEYHAESVSNFLTQAILREELTDAVRHVRFEEAGYDPEEIDGLLSPVRLRTVRVGEEGETAERAEAGFILAYFLGILLYMLLVLYGQQVLLGVLEEKTSRVVEIVISTLRPFDLMMGKLIGICLVGLTQLAIWLGAAALLTAPAVLASLAALPEGFPVPHLSAALLVNFPLYFLLGFFIFSTFYAAIAAACNNVQEAQQAAMAAVVFLIVPLMLMPVVINDPDSILSVVISLVPFFTPTLMLLRIAVKTPPLWQLLLSYVLTAGFAVLMVWVCARIYRVGILMHGKKPSPAEIWRWFRHA